MKFILLFLFIPLLVCAQTKDNNVERYKIIEVEKIVPEEGNNYLSTAGTKKSILLLDSETGRVWHLTTTATQIDSTNFFYNFEWTPIRFSFEEKRNDGSLYLPPPIKQK